MHACNTSAVRSAILDGEVAVPDERGVTHINLLNDALKRDPSRLAFYAFDLVYWDGLNRRHYGLLERKTVLAEVLAQPPARMLRSEHLSATAAPCSKLASSGARGSFPSGSMRLYLRAVLDLA
jgi:ATP-dependent DNA ligase